MDRREFIAAATAVVVTASLSHSVTELPSGQVTFSPLQGFDYNNHVGIAIDTPLGRHAIRINKRLEDVTEADIRQAKKTLLAWFHDREYHHHSTMR